MIETLFSPPHGKDFVFQSQDPVHILLSIIKYHNWNAASVFLEKQFYK